MASKSSRRKSKQKHRKPHEIAFRPNVSTVRNPPSNASQLVTQTQTQITQHIGPIPDAEHLAKYGEVIPDAPERILAMAERQAEHRQWLEKRVIVSEGRRANAGVVCAFIITLVVVLSGAYLVYLGHDVAGTIFSGLGLAGLTGTFIYGTRVRRDERLRRDAGNKNLTRRR